jgi:glutathione reductase (NADPH)
MHEYDYDLLTIGAGSGGVAASRRAASYGAKVAVCESTRVGGTCVLRGCVPKKLLVYASHFGDEIRDAAAYGWNTGPATLDWGALVAAKDRELDRLNAIYLRMLGDAKVEVIEGHARLVAPHVVEVAGRRVTAHRILLATGGWPHTPDLPGAELGITSNEALDLPEVPRRVVVVGGGYIGVEFAGIFAGAGAEVSLVLRGYAVLRGFDDDIRSALGEELTRRGIAVHPHAKLQALERGDDGLELRCQSGTVHRGDVVLWATGRRPNVAGLGLEDLGVETADHGAVVVDQWSRTNVSGLFAIGDCTTRVNLTPVAIADGRALAETLFNDRPTTIDHDHVPTAVFSQPPVATVGLTEQEARAIHDDPIDIYRTNFRPMKYVLPGREERTMMKIVVHRASDRVLGVHVLGADAPEIIQGFAVAVKAGVTKSQFDATVGVHPTSAEELVTMYKPLD